MNIDDLQTLVERRRSIRGTMKAGRFPTKRSRGFLTVPAGRPPAATSSRGSLSLCAIRAGRWTS